MHNISATLSVVYFVQYSIVIIVTTLCCDIDSVSGLSHICRILYLVHAKDVRILMISFAK